MDKNAKYKYKLIFDQKSLTAAEISQLRPSDINVPIPQEIDKAAATKEQSKPKKPVETT
jgi:hypothetical protein